MLRPRILLIVALALSIAGCTRPVAVREAADVASTRLAVMRAQASRQQQLMNAQLDLIANSVAESELRGQVFAMRNDDIPLLWRVEQSADDKKKIRFLSEIRSNDEALLKDPYLLIRKPPPPTYQAATADVSGLNTALQAMSRLSGDKALDTPAAGAFLFDVLGKVELPQQTAPAN